MITSLESIEIFEKINEEKMEKAKVKSDSLADVIKKIDNSEFWALDFYDLPLQDRRIAFLYGFQKSLDRKRSLVRQFEEASSAREIYEKIFSIPLQYDAELDVILFEDHIHFLFDENLKKEFNLPRKEGRHVTLLSDSERFNEYGKQFAGAISIIDRNYPDLKEGAYHERYHGLTYGMPLSQIASIAASYWNGLDKKPRLEPTARNILDFFITKFLSVHIEVNAIYHASGGLDEEKLFSGYHNPTMFQALGIFYPEYLEHNRTVKASAPARLLGNCARVYNHYTNILRRASTEDRKKIQLCLELLMYNELDKLLDLISS